MSGSLRERFLAATSRRFATIDVPRIGAVRIQSLTADEMRSLRESFTDEAGKPNSRLKYVNELLVAACVVEDDGSLGFSDHDALNGDFRQLDGGSFAVLAAACRKHTNFAADPDWKAIEDAAKNSDATEPS